MTRPALRTLTSVVAVAVLFAAAPRADAATRYVADTGTDGPDCGVALASACRSITQAIALAAPGDTILVGPGRYGDLNSTGVLGDISGEETGSPGCSCVLSINKNVIVISTAGAAGTLIDARSMNIVQNVVLLTNGGEFGRPNKGFTVTETGRRDSGGLFNGHGIGIDSANVLVRGNQVIFSRDGESRGIGIFTVNSAAIRIEGNLVSNWEIGIDVRVAGAATVSKNQIISNTVGISARGGKVTGNVATANGTGIFLTDAATAIGNAAYVNNFATGSGFVIAAPFSGVVTKNNLFANSVSGTCPDNTGLVNLGVVGLNATNNYWGAPTGPGTLPASAVCSSGTTTISPFATKPFVVKPLKP